VLALYCHGALCLFGLATASTADVCAWVRGLAARSRSIEDVARAVGLVLAPVPLRGAKPVRRLRVLVYSELAPARWQRALIARETARYALERCDALATATAVERVTEAVRSCVVGASEDRTGRSSSRLRLELS
jgi:hypothetical protein